VIISISNSEHFNPTIDILREGKSLLLKKKENSNLGWYSPTYLCKEPALSFRYSFSFNSPAKITTTWQIIDE